MKHLRDNLYVAGQLQPDDLQNLADSGIKTIINNRPDGEESGQMDHSQAQQLATTHGIAYHYLPMANGQPLPPNLVAEFKAVLEATAEPVLAHCRSGMRSTLLWAIGQILAGNVTPDQAIEAGQSAGIPLANARTMLENLTA